jgi:trimeric autotransporter adhesin
VKGLCLLLTATLAGARLAAPVGSVHAGGATLTVTTTADLATCSPGMMYSLRCAISQANNDGAGDTIAFNIPSSDGGCKPTTINSTTAAVCKIAPASPLPALSASSTVINGYTQPGAAANTNPSGAADNAIITVQLDGTSAVSTSINGLVVRGITDTIEGLSITSFNGNGIALSYARGSTVSGTYVGVAPDGGTGRGNADGVDIVSNDSAYPATQNTIGGTSPAARNVISGNAHSGIALSPSSGGQAGATIVGNYVGTDASGSRALGNGTGITVGGFRAASSATIGGPSAAMRNVIGGNSVAGIAISTDEGAASAIIEGNYVGTDAQGLQALGNGVGISQQEGQATIGGSTVGTGNVISGNAGDGIAISGDALISSQATVQGNFIGTDATGIGALGNGGQGVDVGDYVSATTLAGNVIADNGRAGVLVTYTPPSSSGRDAIPHVLITRNSMFANSGLGIDLAPEHVVNCASTPPGPNDYLPCPIIASVTASEVRGTACAGCTVEVYLASNEADDLGHGGGVLYLGSATADSAGQWSLSPPSGRIPCGAYVTATATAPASPGPADTSEFAANVPRSH